MDQPRSLEAPIAEDLASTMVFLAGPRHVGKTTLARRLLSRWPAGAYLSWDNRDDRREMRAARWPGGDALVVLDELHKWRGWKGWIKGQFDKHRGHPRFLVTGSARLDVYRRGADSLQGRYHHFRLHPFTCAEVGAKGALALPEPGAELAIPTAGDQALLDALSAFGGFPEPFLAQSARTHRRWQKDRLDRFFREDVRDLEPIRDMARIELLADLCAERVGSPLSINALREDLEASHRALTHWVDILDRLHHVFRLRPFAGPRSRSLTKMPKAYLWDWSLVGDPAARFENLVASHLLKFCHALEDVDGHPVALHYLRDRDGREVDFLVTWRRRPWFAVEAKLAETRLDPSLRHFRDRLSIPFAYQVTAEETRDFVQDGVRVLPASKLLAALA